MPSRTTSRCAAASSSEAKGVDGWAAESTATDSRARRAEPPRPTEPETPRHGGDGVDADAPREVVEIHVAGLLDAVDHGQVAMAFLLPAMEAGAAELQEAGAIGAEFRPEAALERRQREHHLE